MRSIRIAFISKTNLNNDGRILNELKIIKNLYGSRFWIDFILMPDKVLKNEVQDVDQFHIISTSFSKSKVLRFLTVFEFSVKAFIKLTQLRPAIIHAQDTSVVLPVLFYKIIRRNKVKVIYDDHELPNSNDAFQLKLFQYFERLLMTKADKVITANAERSDYLIEKGLLKPDKTLFFLNLPYFEESDGANFPKLDDAASIGKYKADNNLRFILHQGTIEEERGKVKLANLSKILPKDVKIFLLGGSRAVFEEFLDDYSLDSSKFYFVGSVPYQVLNEYWKIADASIVMYLPTYLNNRLCAPNRLYISFKHKLPIIVNQDNSVLSNFVSYHKCGLFIEDLNKDNIEKVFNIEYCSNELSQLKAVEVKKLESVYLQLI